MPLRLLVADSAAEKQAARGVEARVFLDAFGNTPELMEQEYGPYSDRSRFVTVIDDRSGSALGAVRLIVPDSSGEVKTLTDVAGEPWRLPFPDVLRTTGLSGAPVWDVATLGVDPRHRRGAAGTEISLFHGVYRYARASGVEGLVTILDDTVLRLVRAMGLSWALMPGATSQYYLGSAASTPCICRVAALPDGVRARRPDLTPALERGVFRSIAVDPADLLPDRGAPDFEVTVDHRRPRPFAAPGHKPDWRPPAYRRTPAAQPVPSHDTPVVG
jgi:hypothetical protein